MEQEQMEWKGQGPSPRCPHAQKGLGGDQGAPRNRSRIREMGKKPVVGQKPSEPESATSHRGTKKPE